MQAYPPAGPAPAEPYILRRGYSVEAACPVCRPGAVSDAYLSGFIKAGEPIGRTLDVDRVMRAAGAVERVMGLDGGRPKKAPKAEREPRE